MRCSMNPHRTCVHGVSASDTSLTRTFAHVHIGHTSLTEVFMIYRWLEETHEMHHGQHSMRSWCACNIGDIFKTKIKEIKMLEK